MPVPFALIDCGLPVPVLVTVIVAFRAPAADGVKVTVMVQFAPAATVVQVFPEIANSDGALLVTPETVTAVPPMLVTVTLDGALDVPTVCVPKVSVVANDSCPFGGAAAPVPLAGTTCGLPAPVLVMVMFALRPPTALGLNVAVTVQLALGASAPHVVVTGNSDVLSLVTPLTVTVEALVLVTVTDAGALVVPMVCVPNVSEPLIERSTSPVPRAVTLTPLSTALGDGPTVRVNANVALRAPPPDGLNATSNVQDALTFSMVPQVLLLTGNSPPLLLLNARPFAAAAPLFVMVTVCVAVVEPTPVFAKLTGFGEACRLGATPGMTDVENDEILPLVVLQVSVTTTPSVSLSSGCNVMVDV